MNETTVAEQRQQNQGIASYDGGVEMIEPKTKAVSGWREWLALPDIGIPGIEAKIDTGTKMSTLHTSFLEHYRRGGELWVRFGVNPFAQREDVRFVCQAPVKSTKNVNLAENQEETLFVIESTAKMGEMQTTLDLVLKNQSDMKFVMHLGRSALQDMNVHVDPNSSYLFGEMLKPQYD